ncbi:ABC transporter ATP-binding protein [Nodosilinea sp. PGN35]|uniref:ABC transporter ATP-binding protein n=1 Tax=Nodosilinea sp. PGN35 TaxID=3020489 RepID=UPI0023B240CD|nr:ABC transporter ATP-binding protein [Nodosilinea sp. TSF1-S3]MDF0369768.1 ABC transporter ATP-binding protein [Nodosilinea sp. TSF1-S3]
MKSIIPFIRRQRRARYPAPSPAGKWQSLRRLLTYVTRYRGAIALIGLLLLVGTVLNLLVPFLLGVAINNISGPQDRQALLQTVIWMALAAVGSGLALMVQGQMLARVAEKGIYDLRRDLFEHMMTLSLTFFDRRPIGELMSGVTNDTEVIALFFRSGLGTLVSDSLKLVFIVVAMVWLSWQLALAAIVIVPLVLAFVGFVSQASGPAFAALQNEVGELNGLMEETVSGEKVVIAYNQQADAIANFQDISTAAMKAGIRARFMALLSRPVTQVLTNFDIALVALVGGLLMLRGAISVGTVATFLQYTRQFAMPITSIANMLDGLFAAIAAAERIFQTLDEKPAIVDRPGAQEMPPIQGLVEFENVDFSYVPGRQILQHNTFKALPGQKIGLCGPTGAGKSTIINLITRYYDIDNRVRAASPAENRRPSQGEGDIRIDGISIYDVTQASLCKQIGIVLQEPFLFSDTVMNNLRYARLEATEKDCIEAAKRANAHDFVMRLPNGYDTLLAERGSNLSQGQRQLLTIARMMVQNPRLVILDEATSNVDTRTEAKIQEALARLMEGRTSLVIAHRLSTIRDSSQILVLKAGAIIERGTHAEMMANQGFYYDLYMSQFKGKLAAAV